jgi:hypothetical protein
MLMAEASDCSVLHKLCASLLLSVLATACGSGKDPIPGGAVAATAPTVTTSSPNDAATTVPITTSVVTASFGEPVAPITGANFTITCDAPCTSPTGAVTLDATNEVASFTFTGGTTLEPLTSYKATVSGTTSSSSGITMAAPFVWTFTTGAAPDTTRPSVTQTTPATTTPGPTTGAALNSSIVVSFSEEMAPATINMTTFSLTCSAPCTASTGSVTYVAGSKSAVFKPLTPLDAVTTYTARITAAAEDLAGNGLAGNQAPPAAASDYVWTFATGATSDTTAPTVMTTSPVGGATGICINKTISATFSEPMDPSTITTATFGLAVIGGAAVAGAVAYDAPMHIATFDPDLNLTGTPATNYTVQIKGGANGVKDLAGNALAADKMSTFTTDSSSCASAPSLGTAAPFGSFGGNATLTNDGLATIINGDVGVNASSTSITGLHDSGGNVYTITTNNNGLVNGLVYTLTDPPGSVAAAAVTQARIDALLAFNSISPAALPGGIDMSSLAQCPSCGGAGGGSDELAGRTLPPGVYLSTTGTYDIGGVGRTTANLTLDANGDTNAVWVFQTAAGVGTLTVGLTGPATPAVPINVLLIGGAQSKNVFWYIPAGASIGTGATMVGTMLADASITMSTTGGSPPTAVLTTLNGRAIAMTAGVTMTNTIVNVPAP